MSILQGDLKSVCKEQDSPDLCISQEMTRNWKILLWIMY